MPRVTGHATAAPPRLPARKGGTTGYGRPDPGCFQKRVALAGGEAPSKIKEGSMAGTLALAVIAREGSEKLMSGPMGN